MKILENKFINTTKAEEEQIARVLELKQFSGMSPIVKEYEEKLAKYFKTKFAHAVSSGTDAIELALRALNIGEGDEVITTPLGPVMTPLPILAVGAKPVFVDVESENNFGISLQDLMAKVSKHTKAVITVPMWVILQKQAT